MTSCENDPASIREGEMKIQTIAMALLVFTATAPAIASETEAAVSLGELSFLLGAWEGELTVHNARAEGERTTVAMRMNAERTHNDEIGSHFAMEYVYTRPNGEENKYDHKLWVTKRGKSITIGEDEWDVNDKRIDENGYRLILLREGDYDGMTALLRMTLLFDGEDIRMTMDVRNPDSMEYATRIEYTLSRPGKDDSTP